MWEQQGGSINIVYLFSFQNDSLHSFLRQWRDGGGRNFNFKIKILFSLSPPHTSSSCYVQQPPHVHNKILEITFNDMKKKVDTQQNQYFEGFLEIFIKYENIIKLFFEKCGSINWRWQLLWAFLNSLTHEKTFFSYHVK